MESVEDNGEIFLKLDSEGHAESQIINAAAETETFDLEIDNLNENDVDLDIIDENGEVEHIDNFDELIEDSYETQSATLVLYGGLTLYALITAMACVAGAVIVGGVTYYVSSKVIDKIRNNKENQKKYYKACIKNHTVYIAFYNGKITKSQGASRIKSGKDVYTFLSSNAKSVVNAAGRGSTGSELHLLKGKFTYRHYHTANRNGAHALYGLPYTKK